MFERYIINLIDRYNVFFFISQSVVYLWCKKSRVSNTSDNRYERIQLPLLLQWPHISIDKSKQVGEARPKCNTDHNDATRND